jgi:hypothetical protein
MTDVLTALETAIIEACKAMASAKRAQTRCELRVALSQLLAAYYAESHDE